MRMVIAAFLIAALAPGLGTAAVSGSRYSAYATNKPFKFEDLEDKFQGKIRKLMKDLAESKSGLTFSAIGNRTPKIQYLMYWSWQIAKEGYRKTKDPEPPAFPGCDIDWFWKNPEHDDVNDTADLYDVPSYVGAAMDMVKDFHLTRNPGLTSKLSEGRATSFVLSDLDDKSSQFSGPKALKCPDNNEFTVSKNGHLHGIFENKELSIYLEKYGVYLAGDSDLDYPLAVYSDDGKWN